MRRKDVQRRSNGSKGKLKVNQEPTLSATRWTCPTCEKPILTSYCPAGGERPLNEDDLKLRVLFKQFFHALSNVDSRLIRSFRNLLRRPGLLTVAYLRGQRMPYTGPIQLFLIANILFFAMQSFTNTNIVSSQLDSHLYNQDWSVLAQRLVTHHLESKHMTLESYSPVFNQAVITNAKSLIIMMVMPFTLLLPILFFRAQRPFVAHIVFSLHLYTFLLLLFCICVAIAAVDVLFGGAGLYSPAMDNVLSIFNLSACAVYLYIATGRVYGGNRIIRAVKVALLAPAVAAILLAYRFVIFLITLYST
jgi:Protein of unknown function (DUF3667)